MDLLNSSQHSSTTTTNNEPLLTPDEGRYVMFPIKYNDVWEMYKKQMDSFWRCEEINMSKDIGEWELMNEDEKYFIKMVLAFFAASDGIVLENLAQRFMNDIENSEIRAFYGMQIFMENIHCVSGDTLILTNKGYVNIQSVVNTNVRIWNGIEMSEVTVKYTGNQPLFNVILNNGMELQCTSGHKWLICDENGKIQRIETQHLKGNEQLVDYILPIIHTTIDKDDIFNEPYYSGKKMAIYLLNIENPIVNKEDIPLNYSILTKLNWLSGLLETAGQLCTTTPHNERFIQLETSNLDFLKQVQLLMTTMGIFTHILTATNVHTLLIMEKYFNELETLGCNVNYLPNTKIIHCNHSFCEEYEIGKIKIKEIVPIANGEDSPTFCFNEPKMHTGIFNGILTGQSEMYSILIDTYCKETDEKNKLLNAIQHFPCIKKKAEWAKKWINDDTICFSARLIAFAIVEGIFFSSSFASIYWIKKRGLLHGLTLSNEFISRDEALHVEFAVLLYKKIVNKLDTTTFYKIMNEAVEIEKEFILEAIPCRLIGMNSGLMSQYIEFVSNRLCLQLGYDKLFPQATNPFDFMELISLSDKVNFFEKTNTQYALANKTMDGDPFDLTTEF
jgi:ribonucleotide reductase beta subunit family protein with ferritin-like domain